VRADMVRAYVESLLERLTGSDKSVPDDDGDYPVRYRNALYYVRLVGNEDPIIQVFSIAVADVPTSAELLEEINRINSEVRFCRVFWVRGQVLVEVDLIGGTIVPETFNDACLAVATVTDNVAPGLAAAFGGRLAFDEQKTGPVETPTAGTGLYL
jgi:Putative bacterial sensory transduction regulator